MLARWEPQLDSLSSRYRCVVVEHRGHGRSQRVPGPYSTDLFAADALAACRQIGVDHAYVVGLSMGGMVAQKLALVAPAFVDALVLCDTFTHTASRGVEGMRAAADLVRAEGFGALRTLIAADGGGWSAQTRDHAPQVARNNLREAESNDPDCWAWAVGALVEHDTRAEIGDIDAPALVVWGAEDTAVPVRLARPLADALGGAELVVLDDAGHVCNLEQPDAFDRAVTAFFDAHPPPIPVRSN